MVKKATNKQTKQTYNNNNNIFFLGGGGRGQGLGMWGLNLNPVITKLKNINKMGGY